MSKFVCGNVFTAATLCM